MPLSDNLILELVKLGFIGLAALIFVMMFVLLLRNQEATRGNAQLRKRFLTLGVVVIGIAAIVQVLPLFMATRLTVTFSPNFDVRELPPPTIQMGEQTLAMDKEYQIGGTRTVKIDVDAALQKVRVLNETATTLTKATAELAIQVSTPSAPAISVAEATSLRSASEELSESIRAGQLEGIRSGSRAFERTVGNIFGN